MDYRREIDGLRALAVVPVILFHAGFDKFQGGFVGVDVFFVISGYLISSIILAEKNAGTFSLIRFYERRARRILPALFFVLAVCIPFAWFWLLPEELKQFSLSIISVALFASNVLFWSQSGYFDTSVELIPLLHTWSLAVEEQYYILFPLSIILFWKLGKRWILGILFALSFASLLAAQWGYNSSPAATFYLLPTRWWELTIGALLSIYSSERHLADLNSTFRETGSALGLLLIFYAVFTFNSNTPFPSLYTLVPTAGAVLIILYATPLTLVGKVLGSKAFVSIGLVSYSAYLWHQPIFAFARIRSLTDLSKIEFAWLSILAFVLAYFSWRYIEKPFRQGAINSRKKVFIHAISGSLVFIVIGTIGFKYDGFLDRLTFQERKLLESAQVENVRKQMAAFQRGVCFAELDQTYLVLEKNQCISNQGEKPRVIIFGDSHAAHLFLGVKDVFGRAGYKSEQWTAAGCRAINLHGNSKRCQDFYYAFIRDVLPRLNNKDVIIVSSYWLSVYESFSRDEIFSSFYELSKAFNKSKASVIVIGSSPAFKKPPQVYMVRAGISNASEIELDSLNNKNINEILKEQSELHDWLFFNPSYVLCDKNVGQLCLVKDNDEFLFLDDSHLSQSGSLFVMRSFWSIYGNKF